MSLYLPETFEGTLTQLLGHATVQSDLIRTELVYASRPSNRYAVRLDGAWQPLVRHVCESMTPYPAEPDLRDIEEWPSVLVKLQFDKDADAEEDICHHLMTQRCRDICPRLLVVVRVEGIRMTFMEWLGDCVPLRELENARSPMLDHRLGEAISTAVRRMWLDAGVAHCDLHTNNVMVSERTKSVYVIDYGMAVPLDGDSRSRLHDAVTCDVDDGSKRVRSRRGSGSSLASLAEAFDQTCKSYASQSVIRRGYEITDEPWNDDGTFLRLVDSLCKLRKKCRAPPAKKLKTART